MPRRTHCAVCGAPLVQPAGAGRPRQFCADRCQRRAARARRWLLVLLALADRSNPQVDAWLKECGL